MKQEKRIQFHVGLGKVASKFLQYQVFPKMNGISYIPTRLFYKADSLIDLSQSYNILVSREFDQQFEAEVTRFAQKHPNTGAIILLRRHDSWIASQYRRFVKNGFTGSFSDFFHVDNPEGRFKPEDLHFKRYIDILDNAFCRAPLIIVYDELTESPKKVIQRMARYCGASIRMEEINVKKVHTSYNEKQLLFMKKVARRIPVNRETWHRNRFIFFWQRLPVLAIRYTVLYLGKMVPASWADQGPLIHEQELETIRQRTRDDWNYVIERAKKCATE